MTNLIFITFPNIPNGNMKVDWIECNKEFNEELAKKLMAMSKHVLIEYRKKNDTKSFISILTSYKTDDDKTIGSINGNLYYEYCNWTEILRYCTIEV